MKKYTLDRGTYKTHLELDNGVIRSHRTQANRAAILDFNRELRKNQGAVRTHSFMKLELNIPDSDWPVIAKFWPGIDDAAHPDHMWQLNRFLKSPASDPYRVNERKKGVNKWLN